MRPAVRRKNAIVILLLALTIDPETFGQTASLQGAPATTAPTQAVIYVQNLSPSALGNRIQEILVTRITEKLQPYNLHSVADPILVDASESQQDEFRIQPLLEQQIPPTADIVVAAVFRIARNSVDIQFILLDPKQKNVLGGVLSQARTGLTLFTSVDSAVNDLDPLLTQYVTNRYEYRPPQGIVEQITFDGPTEGAEVFFAGRNVGRVTGGTLKVPYTPFPVGSRVRVEVRKPGYHPETEVIDLATPRVQSDLPHLKRAHRFAAGMEWAFGQALGFGVTGRVFGVPDSTYLELTARRSMESFRTQGFHDLRHYDFGVSIGQYLLLSYRSPVRLSLTLGAGVIRTSVEDGVQPDFSDVYLNLLSPTVEIHLAEWQLFVRPLFKFTVGLGDNLLGRSWVTSSLGLPPISLGVLRSW